MGRIFRKFLHKLIISIARKDREQFIKLFFKRHNAFTIYKIVYKIYKTLLKHTQKQTDNKN